MSELPSSEHLRSKLIAAIPPEKIRQELCALADQSADPTTAARARKLAAGYNIDLSPDRNASNTDADAE